MADGLALYTKPELAALAWYTGGEYSDLNEALRTGHRLPPTIQSYWHHIQNAFRKTPPQPALTVYRGKHSDKIRPVLTPLSTSRTVEGTGDFVGVSCCILEISVPEGTRYIDLSHISQIPSENEVLLPALGSLHLTSTDIRSVRYKTGMEHLAMKWLSLTYLPPESVAIELAEPEQPTMKVVQEQFTAQRLADLILEDELELYDTRADLIEAIRLSAPKASQKALEQAADLLRSRGHAAIGRQVS